MSRKKKRRTESGNTLLGDLESIRGLLEQDTVREADENPNIPVLDDMIDGGMEVDETPLQGKIRLQPTTQHSGGLTEGAIKALLGKEWQKTAENIISTAREDLNEQASVWQSQNNDELIEALHMKLDQTLNNWLSQIFSQHIDELRRDLLATVEEEIKDYLAKFSQAPKEN